MKMAHCRLHGISGHDGGRKLLAALYREATGKEMGEIRVTQRGKPYFADSPLHFSITHTPRHAFCVLSECKVGVDAEELDRQFSEKLAQKVLSPREFIQYEAASDKARAFLTFWVLKEAAAKCSGEGLTGYPNDTDFSLDDPRVTEIDGCLVAVLEEGE